MPFAAGLRGVLAGNYPYDLHLDGKQLAIIAAPDQGSAVQNPVVVVSNFFDYRKIAPGQK